MHKFALPVECRWALPRFLSPPKAKKYLLLEVVELLQAYAIVLRAYGGDPFTNGGAGASLFFLLAMTMEQSDPLLTPSCERK